MIPIVKNDYFIHQKRTNYFHLGSSVLSTDTQFNDIEDAMSNLESTIKHLDAYSRSLESQVKKFEKMSAANRTKSPKKD
jgi:predicted  nucleic acid-binding Zn-ribbon protein